jgi:alpha-L-fucosidase
MATISPGASREVPAWFDDAKLGILIHWTAAAIPAFAPVPQSHALDPAGVNPEDYDPDTLGSPQMWRSLPFAEMYQNAMAIPDSAAARYHQETYADLPYDAFIEKFRTEMIPGWDPQPWADLFAQAGARYVVLCTKIEDGFLLWPSDHRNPHKGNWQSDRDVVGELAAAVRKHDLRFGTYYSGGFDWTFGGLPVHDGPSYTKAMPQGENYRIYVDAHWRELVLRYRSDVLWNDYGKSPREADLAGLFRWYRQQVPDGLVNDRFDTRRQGKGELPADFVTPEYAMEGPADRNGRSAAGWATASATTGKKLTATTSAPQNSSICSSISWRGAEIC